MEAALIYGFDPLCGWCYGIVPAMRRVASDHPDLPIRLTMAGLVTGDRVGPYAAMEGYIRGASDRLRAVTGRAPSEAFFRTIARSGVIGDSAPPSVAIAHVMARAPDRALAFAHAVIEAHFEAGANLGDPAAYPPILAALGLDPDLPDLADPALAGAAWAEGRRLGIRSFPTLAVLRDGEAHALPSEYDPARLSALVARAVG